MKAALLWDAADTQTRFMHPGSTANLRLEFCDMFRDGGSMSVIFRTASDELFGYTLSADHNRILEEGDNNVPHAGLYRRSYPGDIKPIDEPIPRGSNRERRVLALLDQWLARYRSDEETIEQLFGDENLGYFKYGSLTTPAYVAERVEMMRAAILERRY